MAEGEPDEQQTEQKTENSEQHVASVEEINSRNAALKELCDDYAKYLEFPDLTKKQFQTLEDTVENMLARLDEFGAFVDTITADTTKASRAFPVLEEKCAQISKMFPVIDAIQGAVDKVKATVDALEERTAVAEKQVGALNIGFDATPLKWLANKVGTSQFPQIEQKWTPIIVTLGVYWATISRRRRMVLLAVAPAVVVMVHAPPAIPFLQPLQFQMPTAPRFMESLPQNGQVYLACCVISIFLICFLMEAP